MILKNYTDLLRENKELRNENKELNEIIFEQIKRENELFDNITTIVSMNNYGEKHFKLDKIKELINDFEQALD